MKSGDVRGKSIWYSLMMAARYSITLRVDGIFS